MNLAIVAGARPNFMKVSALIDVLRRHNVESGVPLTYTLVHTGQHYDDRMSAQFFRDLQLPEPNANLGVGSGSHAWQTAEIMKRFEQFCLRETPTCVIVVGDVNSTIACALVAKKMGITVAHVEAGLRSFDRNMPEEINRVLTDAISDYLFASEEDACKNLRNEGVAERRIYFVGNVMVDTLLRHRARASESNVLDRLGLASGAPYSLLTLHRPSNVDDPEALQQIMTAARQVAQSCPVVFPVHPRTLANIQRFGLMDFLFWNDHTRINVGELGSGVYGLPPLGYLDFLNVMANARAVMTDSGGIQEETTILKVPCVTIRENTERPVTVTRGTNRLAGTTSDGIVKCTVDAMAASYESVEPPPLWDGNAATRIVSVLAAEEQRGETVSAFVENGPR